MFATVAPPARADIALPLDGIETSYDHRDTDERHRALRAVVGRQGQPRFRAALLYAYGRTCAITGCTASPVLEAAHIDPYLGEHTQHVTDGLLLRSDVHTLFDLYLIAITADLTVAVSPELTSTEASTRNTPWFAKSHQRVIGSCPSTHH